MLKICARAAYCSYLDPSHWPLSLFMKLNTAARIFLSMLSVCVLVLPVNGIAGRISFGRAFLGCINQQGVQRMQQIAVNVAAEYQAHGSWAFREGKPEAWFRLLSIRPG